MTSTSPYDFDEHLEQSLEELNYFLGKFEDNIATRYFGSAKPEQLTTFVGDLKELFYSSRLNLNFKDIQDLPSFSQFLEIDRGYLLVELHSFYDTVLTPIKQDYFRD